MDSPDTGDSGSLKAAIGRARGLLAEQKFEAARELGASLLQHYPDEPNSAFVLASGLQGLGRHQEALAVWSRLVSVTPNFGLAFIHGAQCHEALSQPAEARRMLEQGLALLPKHKEGWRQLAEICLALNDPLGWQAAMARYGQLSGQSPLLLSAVEDFQSNRLPEAERKLRDHLKSVPNDVSALRLLADVGIRQGVYDDAQALLERVLSLAPDFHLARLNYAHVLSRRSFNKEALQALDALAAAQPDFAGMQVERAAVLGQLGRFDEAISLYRKLLARMPGVVRLHNSLGHLLKTVGQRDAAEAAYLQAIETEPANGEAWWSLADLKNYRFSVAQQVRMQALLSENLPAPDASQIHFALAKSLEDQGDALAAFDHYQSGNRLKQQAEPWLAGEHTALVRRIMASTPASVFAGQQGCEDPSPIFIVGLPRAGSTLLEQILSSHPLVEGTKELPDITALVRKISGKRNRQDASAYPENIAGLSEAQCCALGEEYLQRTRQHRTDLPFFIDKMPNNFVHIGLIKRILPNAKIIDARRHPLACCFSAFKQHFANGQTFSYDLEDLGHYYRDYVALMDHWHSVLPGQLITVHYEQVVDDLETQVRRLLDYCGLEFAPQCLSFYETRRAVRTASSEQVREPINRKGLDAWSPFESRLQPLKQALGEVLTAYPAG